MTSEQKKVGRRDFMSTAAAAAGLMIIKPELVRGTAANSALRVGLLGCGERGTHVATALSQHPNARYVALGDLFSDQLDKAKQHFDSIAAKKGYAGIDPKLMFKGPKAYQAIAESSQLDVIHIATPDFFHPWHLEAVIAAGKQPDRVLFRPLFRGAAALPTRDHESYVVLVGDRTHYWPRVRLLRPNRSRSELEGARAERRWAATCIEQGWSS